MIRPVTDDVSTSSLEPARSGAPTAVEPFATESSSAHSVTLRVSEADLDEQAHVNNIVYVRWVQDTAIAHWVSLTSEADRAQVGWVCTRHEIDYLAPAVLGDELVVRTQVGHARGLTFERHTDVRRLVDGRVLARSRTLWCPVDPRTGRPRRVSDALRTLFSLPLRNADGLADRAPQA